ncbi:MAG: hypothetical protein ACXABH_13430 [Candidatus Thorarchaeota archaeon]|jgi:hypothetical protein
MNAAERFVKVCGEVGNFSERITGVSVVDAFTGPEELHPNKQSKDKTPSDVVHDIRQTIDAVKDEIEDPLRKEYMMGELHSLNIVVDWLDGRDLSYSELVEGLFQIPMEKFSEREIDKSIENVTNGLEKFPGDDLIDKLQRFAKEGEVTGEALQSLLESELQQRSLEIGNEFRNKIFSVMGASVPDNGVEYEAVRDEPWGGYNWYQGGFKSLNQFNIDRKFNKDSLQATIYHEYEHHVSNLWREKAYLNSGNLELSIVPLHTGRCVISEGTADSAKDFLGVSDIDPRILVLKVLSPLRRMTQINAAILLNDEGKSVEDTVDYLCNRGYRSQESAEASIPFIAPKTKDGKINFFAPYIFTYFIGRTRFVHPTFLKAKEKDVIPEFFKTVYMNPYSGSSVTWNKAFEMM